MNSSKIPGLMFFFFFALVLYLMFLIAYPIHDALIFGAILSGALYPLFRVIMAKTGWSRPQAALLTCLLSLLVLVVPIIYLIGQLSQESLGLYQYVRSEVTSENLNHFFEKTAMGKSLTAFLDRAGIEFNLEWLKTNAANALQTLSGVLIGGVERWVANFMGFLFDLVVMIMVMYALFVEGERLKRYLLELSPLPDHQEELILRTFNQMNFVTLVCNGLGGLIQGTLAGFAFAIAGLPSVVFWTFTMILLAFIPIVGISIIYIPACIYLIVQGKLLASLLLFGFCTAVALVVENWFKPRFIGDRIQINSLFVLFCIIGGMSVFGMAGVFYGPLIGIIFLTMVEIYHDHYSPHRRQLQLSGDERLSAVPEKLD